MNNDIVSNVQGVQCIKQILHFTFCQFMWYNDIVYGIMILHKTYIQIQIIIYNSIAQLIHSMYNFKVTVQIFQVGKTGILPVQHLWSFWWETVCNYRHILSKSDA